MSKYTCRLTITLSMNTLGLVIFLAYKALDSVSKLGETYSVKNQFKRLLWCQRALNNKQRIFSNKKRSGVEAMSIWGIASKHGISDILILLK